MSIYDIKSAVIVLKLNTVKYVLGILIALNPDISIIWQMSGLKATFYIFSK